MWEHWHRSNTCCCLVAPQPTFSPVLPNHFRMSTSWDIPIQMLSSPFFGTCISRWHVWKSRFGPGRRKSGSAPCSLLTLQQMGYEQPCALWPTSCVIYSSSMSISCPIIWHASSSEPGACENSTNGLHVSFLAKTAWGTREVREERVACVQPSPSRCSPTEPPPL